MKYLFPIIFAIVLITGSATNAHAQTLMDTTAATAISGDLDSSQSSTLIQLGTTPNEQAYAKALAASDKNIGSVTMSQQKVSVSYKTQVKLFGFIPVQMPVTASSYGTGETTVVYPWYKFLAPGNSYALLEADVRAVANEGSLMVSEKERESLAEQLYMVLRAHLSGEASLK